MNVYGTRPYEKYNWCSRCRRYIIKGEKCQFHPGFKLRTNPRYSTNSLRVVKRIE